MMVWFFLIPSIPDTLGNFLMPLMIGAQGPGFPAAQSAELVPVHRRRAVDALRAGRRRRRHRLDVLHAVLDACTPTATWSWRSSAVFIAGFSSILTGLNFIVTIHKMRAPGMTWFRLPLFVWSIYATSIILVLATPVLAITLAAARGRAAARQSASSTRRWAATRCCSSTCSGSTRHPAVYIMILPGMGVISEIVTCFSRKPIFGYKFVAWCQRRDRGDRLPGLGPPHVRRRAVALRRPGLLAPELRRRGAVGDQGVQLDRHAVQGLDPLRRADALRAGLHRPVHDRRADRAVPGRRWRSTSTCTTPTSSSRISTTSWSAAR